MQRDQKISGTFTRRSPTFVEYLESRVLLSGSALEAGFQRYDGSLGPTESTSYPLHLTRPGWIFANGRSSFRDRPNYFEFGSFGVDILRNGVKLPHPGGSANYNTPGAPLEPGDYEVKITSRDTRTADLPQDFALFTGIDYAGETFATALDGGALAGKKSFPNYVRGTFGSSTVDVFTFQAAGPTRVALSAPGLGGTKDSRIQVYVTPTGSKSRVLLATTASIGTGTLNTTVPAGQIDVVVLPHQTGALLNYSLEVVANAAPPTIANFVWSMPDRYGVDTNNNGLTDLSNSFAYAHPTGFSLHLDGSASQCAVPIKYYTWTFSGAGLAKPITARSSTATFTSTPLKEGTYTLLLTVTDAAGVFSASTKQSVKVRDYLIVALGDSFGSGEGNPEVASTNPATVKWADGVTSAMTRENLEAHRSTLCYSSQAALMLERADPHTSVTYINLCESGAEVPQGLLGPWQGRTDESYSLHPEIAELAGIVGTRTIDSLILSIGGNDFGFSDFISRLILRDGDPTGLWETQSGIRATAQQNLAALSGRFDNLATALGAFSITHTYITAYPDMAQVSPGVYAKFATDVIPGGLLGISADSAKFASVELGDKLNATLKSAAQAHGWDYVDGYLSDFRSHGYAASVPWFRRMSEARTLQGSESSILVGTVPISRGGFHPNTLGHTDESKYVLNAIKSALT